MGFRKNSALNILAMSVASASALTTSAAGVQNGCLYDVTNLGSFTNQFSFDFSQGTEAAMNDLEASTYTVQAGISPLARRFDQSNIAVSSDGALTLTVPGGQTTGPISSSQITTAYSDVLYGSVRTVAMISSAAGTTHGFSFYSNDTQEIDFAFLTSDTSMVHLTNEQNSNTSPISTYTYAAPSDATTAYHEYRVDWTASATSFYIDGTLVKTITDNVPSTPGFFLWNNWSNGNDWAQGPPTSNSVLKIKSVAAYFNRTSVVNTLSTTCKSSSASSASSATTSSLTYTPAPTATNVQLCPKYDGTVYTVDSGLQYMIACGVDFAGGDFTMSYTKNLAACMELCSTTSGCVDVSLSGTACYMKNKLNQGQKNSGVNAARLLTVAYPY